MLEEVLHRSDEGLADALDDPRMAQRERVAATQPTTTTAIDAANIQNPIQLPSVLPA